MDQSSIWQTCFNTHERDVFRYAWASSFAWAAWFYLLVGLVIGLAGLEEK
jgi:hypothetical protein